ncbi:WecB/TagA/CpsF family glycosyltransferase [Roseibium salinum]|uniref:WecB/TagA/CpsF family glycosyltransferase n=1 Tax=Roseibium salinum TaxID=1604349 RepID=A0ABT3R526_9HYPH|nr:WecB/TagA/CpsF family glycosyltransferase [Roseibium sp. DSM 29163]MCX2724231.1 WecB/TagA/CpsF family glycosyltransferase [Roseibium sp. DSM 29163]
MNNMEPKLSSRIDTADIGPFMIARLRSEEVTGLVRSSVEGRQPLDIAICNAHTILTALDNPDYAAMLKQMTLLNDGVGVNLAGRFLEGKRFPENLNGTDLIPRILQDIDRPLRVFLLGAREPHVLRTKRHIETAYPVHEVVGYRNGYFGPQEISRICADINHTRPDLLLVAMGNPHQEAFIVQNRAKLDVPVAIGVGALFDFMSGSVVRAPRIMQAMGLEWLFRLLQEPRRLYQRYVIGIPRFFLALLKLKFHRSSARARAS